MGTMPDHGTGALCPEAQADGVPCETVESDCSTCERTLAGQGGTGETRARPDEPLPRRG
jgi:hypothetical protein